MINYKKLHEGAHEPKRGSICAAGYDLYAIIDGDTETIAPGKNLMIRTGVAVEIPDGCFGAIFARSGLASKQGLRPSTCVSVIDPDYTGEIYVSLYNDSGDARVVRNGDRIAQMVIIPFVADEFHEVQKLKETERGDGGFGSTGVSDEQIPWQMSIFDYCEPRGSEAPHMKWSEFNPERTEHDYEDTNIECPKCGRLLKRYVRTVLLTYPAKYRYDCLSCGWSDVK